MITKNNIIASILSGILLIIVFPKFSIHYLVWFALIPLIWAIKNEKNIKNSFLLGWCCGRVFFIGLLYWLVSTITYFGNIPFVVCILIFLFLCLYLGSYIGIFASLVNFLIKAKMITTRRNKPIG